MDRPHVPGELLVKFVEGSLSAAAQAKLLARLGAKVEHRFDSGALKLSFASKDENDLAARGKVLAADPRVLYVEANSILHLVSTLPNDPDFAKLYALRNTGATGGRVGSDIKATEAWDVTTGSRQVLVGVIDTGIDYRHPDLAVNYWTNPSESGSDAAGRDKRTNGIDDDGNGYVDDYRGWDFVNNDNDPMDDHSHGTHCAGTIGGVGNNGVGVTGVNWNVSLVGLKFLNSAGSGTLDGSVRAVEYATKIKVAMTSNSWGGGDYSPTLAAAIAGADQAGILFIAAAGNDAANNDATPSYPSSYASDNVIAVAATDHNDALAGFSSYGATAVDLAAPGVNIWSSVPNGSYGNMSGTSMATPHVAGVAALVKAAYPQATVGAVKARILNTTDPVPALRGKVLTGGRLNAFNALENDTVAPGVVAGLAVVANGITFVEAGWQAAGDDVDSGSASRYEMRWAAAPIDSEAAWNAAQSVGVRITVAANNTMTGRIEDLTANTAGFLAVKAFDNVGNAGPVSPSIAFATRSVLVLYENAGDNLNGFTFDPPWGIETDAATGAQYLSDSPGGSYGINLDVKARSPEIALTGTQFSLTLRTSYQLEARYDFAILEASRDGGATWFEIDRFTGSSVGFVVKSYELGARLSGATSVSLRLRLKTDYDINYDGWKIDTLRLISAD